MRAFTSCLCLVLCLGCSAGRAGANKGPMAAGASPPTPTTAATESSAEPPPGLLLASPPHQVSLRAAQPCPIMQVLWGGRWWRAEIVERRGELTKIHYTGWGNEWDEWVECNRTRCSQPLENPRVGQRVRVEWRGRDWDGEILEAGDGLFKVHYTGWGNEWDEWVESGRLGAMAAKNESRDPIATACRQGRGQ